MKLFGFVVPRTLLDVVITQIGPGIVQLYFDTPMGKIYVVETVTPIAPLLQWAGHVVYGGPRCPRIFAKFVLWALITQFERDVPIWNKKTFVNQPLVVKGDGPLLAYRRWMSKFFSKSSVQTGSLAW